ncbi:SLP adapter and CSK-interacting membrane protein [Ambystoma mexicanum]|uniref:SLP adapter and CSK-interacting membrane protein n=1 Tax=Ambystoma mexicanum TaxID=8296 RepID=UPI0037E7EEA7
MGRASGAVNRAPMDPEKDWTLLTWLRNNRWIILIVGIIFISCVISIIMVCVCRSQLSRGLSKRFSKSFGTGTQNSASYENSIRSISEHVPLPPSRHVTEVEDACYSNVQNERFVEVEDYLQETTRPSSSGYIDVVYENGENIYDDAIIPPSTFHYGVIPCP